MPLSLALDTKLEDRLAGGMDAQLRRVEHPQAGDVVVLPRAGPHHLSEARDPDTHQLALLPFFRLLLAKLVITDFVERQAQCLLVLAAVVLEAGRRLVWELVRLDEILDSQFGGILIELDGCGLDQPLDQVRRFRDPEGAAVGNAAGCLVRIGAIGHDVGGRDVVGTGHDVEQPGSELRRLGVGVERAVVAEQLHPDSEDTAVVAHRHLALHVEVAGEAGGDEVFTPILDPLHRLADEQRSRRRHHVAGIDRHFVPEATADIGRNDPDVLLRQAGDDGEEGAVRVRGLRCHVEGGVPGRRVDIGHDAAGLDRRGVAARIERLETDDPVRFRERVIGLPLVARLPVVDVVGGLTLFLVPNHRRAGLQRLRWVNHRGQHLVTHVDQGQRISGDVGIGRDYAGDLLALETDFVGRQHGLRVPGEGRHPGQLVLFEELACYHRHHPGESLSGGGVDGVDAGMSERAAQDRHVQHSRQHDVVDVVALAADEAVVFLPLDALADKPLERCLNRHNSTPCDGARRHRRGLLHLDGGATDGLDDVHVSRAATDVPRESPANLFFRWIGIVGEQREAAEHHPRRAEPALQAVLLFERLLDRMQLACADRLHRRQLPPIGLDRQHRAGLDRHAVEQNRAGAAMARITTDMGTGQAQPLPDEMDEQQPRLDLGTNLFAVDRRGD